MNMLAEWLKGWFKQTARPRLVQFFIHPWKALACLFLGHRPMLVNGDLVSWTWFPRAGDIGEYRQTDGTREVPGAKFFACYRCGATFCVPGPVRVEANHGSRHQRRVDEREARRAMRKALRSTE
jgi:hypothetical protein